MARKHKQWLTKNFGPSKASLKWCGIKVQELPTGFQQLTQPRFRREITHSRTVKVRPQQTPVSYEATLNIALKNYIHYLIYVY